MQASELDVLQPLLHNFSLSPGISWLVQGMAPNITSTDLRCVRCSQGVRVKGTTCMLQLLQCLTCADKHSLFQSCSGLKNVP